MNESNESWIRRKVEEDMIMINKSQKGQTLIEFAFILPLLLVLLLGIIEFSVALYDKAVITNASREGARVGIVAQDRSNTTTIDNGIKSAVNNYCAGRLINFAGSSSPKSITITWPSTKTYGNPLAVNVQYDFNFIFISGFIPGLPNPLNMDARTVMLLE